MLTDKQVLQLILGGEVNAYETLIRRYQRQIFQLAYRLVWSQEEAEDMTQEAFLKAYQNLSHFDLEAEFYPWLHKVAVNSMLSHLKRYTARRENVEYNEEQYGSERYSPANILETNQRASDLRAALASLAPAERLILTLRGIEGLSYEQIAKQLDCPVGTVMSRLNRARQKLKELRR